MKAISPVFEALARHYETTFAGRTGQAARDLLIDFEELLSKAKCKEGDKRALAEQELREQDGKLIEIQWSNSRVKSDIYRIRFSPEKEAAFYEFLAQPSPANKREHLSSLFSKASADPNVPEKWRPCWDDFCRNFSGAARNGDPLPHFDRNDPAETAELLALLPNLLAWPDRYGESLVRFASCVLCENKSSKRLEELAAKEKEGELQGKLRGRLGKLLEIITHRTIRTLDDLGILANPRFVLIHGPIRFLLHDQWLELALLYGPSRISLEDIRRITCIETTARRCLTVENEASFHELAKLQSGELLIQTSYPNSATVNLLQKLPDTLEFWHFGDSDEAGFKILGNLCKKSRRDFRPLQMEKGRIPFEQEALGPPALRQWPFYPEQLPKPSPSR
jgi:hypothetical protein